MFWTKFFFLLIGFLFAGLLPFTLYRVVNSLEFNLRKQTLSYISIKEIYGKKYQRGYTYLMFFTAIICYLFFILLADIYDLHEFETVIRQIDYCFLCLVVLAFIPFNVIPYGKGNFLPNVKRVLHNIFAVFVFLSFAILIILFNIALFDTYRLLSIVGFVIIAVTLVLLLVEMRKNAITGISELMFINGLSIWCIVVVFFTVLR